MIAGRPRVFPVLADLLGSCPGPYGRPFGLALAISYIRSAEQRVPAEERLPAQPRELRSTS